MGPNSRHAVLFVALVSLAARASFPGADPRVAPVVMDVDNSSVTVPTAAWAPALIPSGFAYNLYGWVGLMPRINDDGTLVNGGVPQAGNLTAHLLKFAADAAGLLPLGSLTEGACLLDWEFWRAEWNRTGEAYQNLSLSLAGGDAALARAQYEAGARAFYEGSLRAFASWYPLCAAGLYAYPANDWSNGGYPGPEGDAMRAQNDALEWLWAASGAVFPVVYLTSPGVSKYDNQTTTAYVSSTVDEGVRCAALAPRRPLVFALMWYVYDAFPRPTGVWPVLTPSDVALVTSLPAERGADALLIWGAVGNEPFLPEQLGAYLNSTLGPALNESYATQLDCSRSRCSGAGRCVADGACACVPPAHGPDCSGRSPINAAITLNSTTVAHMGDPLKVDFAGLSSDGWVGVFCPSTANASAIAPIPNPGSPPWTAEAPVKYWQCADVPGCAGSGSGSITAVMVNTFEDCAVIAFAGGLITPIEVARSAPVTFTAPTAPLRGHLSRTRDPSEMLVVWNAPDAGGAPRVEWGDAPDALTQSSLAEADSYVREDLCGPSVATTAGWAPPHAWLRARVSGLTPGSARAVWYRYGSDSGGWSVPLAFAPAPAPGAPVHIGVTADVGMAEPDGSTTMNGGLPEAQAARTIELLRARLVEKPLFNFSAVVHAGDLSYAIGYAHRWDLFASRLEGLADRVPYLTGLGNHERDWPGSGSISDFMDSGGECGIPTTVRFPSPTQNSRAQDSGWWSIEHGAATLIMLNTEVELGPGSDQWDFVNETLAAVDRARTPWVFLFAHRPFYFAWAAEPNGGAADPRLLALEPLLVSGRVDAVFAGHVHNVAVTCPLVNATCVQASTSSPRAYRAPTHIIIGHGGHDLSAVAAVSPPWIEYARAEHGYGTLHVWNSTDASVELFGDDDDALRYTVWLSREV